jgi:hypothetical protein
MSRCHHGHVICESWQECPECCEEHDGAEAADAARDSFVRPHIVLPNILPNISPFVV